MMRWVPAVGLVVTILVFGLWTSQALLAGDSVGTVVRFLLGIGLGSYLLLVHRLTAVRRRLAEAGLG